MSYRYFYATSQPIHPPFQFTQNTFFLPPPLAAVHYLIHRSTSAMSAVDVSIPRRLVIGIDHHNGVQTFVNIQEAVDIHHSFWNLHFSSHQNPALHYKSAARDR